MHSPDPGSPRHTRPLPSEPRTSAPPDPAASGGRRIGELDALRGLALCGIIFVNIPAVLWVQRGADGQILPVPHAFDMFIQQRFFPIFSLLFGVGFGLFLAGAAQRADRPRVLLLRRLLALAGFGFLHQFLHPGEALLPYAIAGLLVLLPTSFLPWQANLPLGVALVATALAVFSGGVLLVPGLLLTGFALAQCGIPAVLHRRGPQVAAVFGAASVASAACLVWQEQDPLNAGFTHSSAIAGLCLAITYSTGLFLLWRTPVRRVLSATLAPLGRMALTNYVTATLLFVPLGHLLGLPQSTSWGTVIALAVGILVVQIAWSHAWLTHLRYGPLEWIWRCVTWWSVVPLRRAGAHRSLAV